MTARRAQAPPSPSEADAVIAEMVRRLVERFHPLRILLFGSRARGGADPWSDVDLLVVVQEAKDPRALAVQMRRALADMPLPKDVLVATPEDVARRRNVIGDVLRPALAEGRVLYEAG